MTSAPFDLTGKVAIVTGSTRGIGRAIAAAALFLTWSAAGFVTGHNLVVDGGIVITDGG